MARKKSKGTELSVFKGREAKLNRAIFQTLALKGPQTIYEMHKEVKTLKGFKNTRYANVNVRVRLLESSGFVKKTATKKTKAGFESTIYDIATKAYFAMLLSSINVEDFLTRLDDTTATELLATIIKSSQK